MAGSLRRIETFVAMFAGPPDRWGVSLEGTGVQHMGNGNMIRPGHHFDKVLMVQMQVGLRHKLAVNGIDVGQGPAIPAQDRTSHLATLIVVVGMRLNMKVFRSFVKKTFWKNMSDEAQGADRIE